MVGWLDSVLVRVNGNVRLNVMQSGPKNGPLVILLHGFPEGWYGWRHQVGALAEAGFRVLVPNQRGYYLSDKPGPVAAYSLEELMRDVSGLIASAGHDKAYVIGHDWGGLVAWWLATRRPEKVERFAVLNAPHPLVLLERLRTNAEEIKKSWYPFYFQIADLSTSRLRRKNWALLKSMLRQTVRPDVITENDLRRYEDIWELSNTDVTALNYHRAMLQIPLPTLTNSRLAMPALMLWGAQQSYYQPQTIQESAAYCEAGTVAYVAQAGHWLHHEQPASVNHRLIEFCRQPVPRLEYSFM
ncbi:MAG TPA: alpha/beta hydrolase [Phototrophicaceae bacterium]|nr:alpha/beta hydrolase [Phototrophicaceae bacterium]